MKKIDKIALVGFGNRGQFLARLLRERGVRPKLIIDNAFQLVRYSDQVEVAPVLLQAHGRFDLIIVATPTYSHSSISMELMATCDNMLVEKPCGKNEVEAKAIAAEGIKTNTNVFVGFSERFNKRYLEIISQSLTDLLEGKFDCLRIVRQREASPHSLGDSREATYDLGCHDLDLVLWLLSGRGVTVSRAEVKDHSIDLEVQASAARSAEINIVGEYSGSRKQVLHLTRRGNQQSSETIEFDVSPKDRQESASAMLDCLLVGDHERVASIEEAVAVHKALRAQSCA